MDLRSQNTHSPEGERPLYKAGSSANVPQSATVYHVQRTTTAQAADDIFRRYQGPDAQPLFKRRRLRVVSVEFWHIVSLR
jgi:hypothetical protein